MPVTITLPDEITFVAGGETFTHRFGDDTPAMVARACAHGLGQMVGDAAAMTREEMDGMTPEAVAAEKRSRRHKAFANRHAWMRSDPRMPTDDSIWVNECKEFLRLLDVGHKERAAIKSVAEGKAALLKASPSDGESYILAVTHNANTRKAALADPRAAVKALVDAALAKAAAAPAPAPAKRKSA